jgi:outer membrane protein assembly factor BamB/predicted Ser/Thr protein kinase
MLPLGADDPRVIGEFRLHFRLGAGGMGRVYLGSSPGGRAVAVKVIHARLARDPAFRGRFRREVAAAQAVNGAYAAPVVAAGPDDDPPWLATAYVAGPSLHEAVTETGPLPEDAVLKLAAGLAEALRAIHDAGLVHRDLKPGNVLLAEDGPRVIDFGVARAGDGTVLTSAGSVLGTPAFMSPEQAQGQQTGPASDVFSLGAVVYFAATGTGPFGSGSPAVMVYRVVHAEPDLDPLPAEVRGLAAACLAKDPAQRPGPAELTASLTGAPPPGGSQPAFWPAAVARLIADHQIRFAAGLMASGPASAEPVTVVRAPATPPLPADPATPSLPAEPATPPRPPGRADARPGRPQPVPGMNRRRALAALAGMATAGLVVAGWELTRPGPAAAGDLTAQRRVSSLRPGTQVWSFEANGKVVPIATDGDVVYAGTLNRAVYAFDALTGKPLWQHLMDANATTKTQLLTVADGVLVAAQGFNGIAPAGYGGGVYALDPATGRLLWNTEAPIADGLAVAGGVVYAGTAIKDPVTGGLTALSAGTGELLWTFDFPTPVDSNEGVQVSDGVVYATTFKGEVWALSAASGTPLWRFADPERGAKFTNGILINDGIAYVSPADVTSGTVLHALQASTGRVLWQHPLGPSPDSAAMATASGLVFAGLLRQAPSSSSPGVGQLSALNAATGQLLWQVPVAGGMWAMGTGSGNAVYTANSHGVIDAWQADTGNHLGSYRAAAPFSSVPKLADGIAYFGCTNQRIYAVTVPA